jgi:hypothetical protein
MVLPSSWNRSRATALGITLLLHLLAAYFFLMHDVLRLRGVEESSLIWLPAERSPPKLPPASAIAADAPPLRIGPIHAEPLPMPLPEVGALEPPDWSASAREVAKSFGAKPSYQPFGEVPKGPPQRPKEQYPPSIWEQPLPRVGKTVVTPEGESILWVSDNCWVSLSSRSLTLQDLHQARQGVRMCQIGAGKKKVRGDLFDSIKRPPPPQEPGCGPDGIGQSCGR